MADNTTGLPVQTITGQFVSTKLVDSAGSNVAAVDASGRLAANLGAIGGTAPSATNPLFVELSTGAAAYTLFGQTNSTAPFARITDGTTNVAVIAGTTALKTDLSSIGGTAPGATAFVPARLTDGSAYYTKTGQAVGTAAFASITDGTLTATVRDTGTSDSLNVSVVDAAGNQVTSFGGGTQYVGDAGATATPTGTMAMGLANSAAPSDVSANNDAVAMWMLRNGSPVMNIASGGTLVTVGQKAMAASLPVVLPSDGVLADATHPGYARLTDGTTAYAKTGQTVATAAFAQLSDQTTAVNVIAGTNALKIDVSSVAGTATVTGGVAGTLGVAGIAAHDAVFTNINPALVGAGASAAAPSDVSADGDLVRLWALRNGSLVVNLAAGGTLLTQMGQTAATGNFSKITDGTTTAGVIVGTTALKTDLSSIGGTAPGATAFVPARLTDGAAYYTKTGQAAGTASYVQISDQTNLANVIAGTNALKTDLSSYLGSVVSVTNPVSVRLSDGAAFYAAASGAPTDPKYGTATSAALGAGASVRLNHYVTSGKTGQLIGIDAGATVPCKVEIQTIVTGTPTTRVVLFTKPYEVYQWRAPYKTFITRASADATSGFSVTMTNKDAAVAADVYSTGYWDEV